MVSLFDVSRFILIVSLLCRSSSANGGAFVAHLKKADSRINPPAASERRKVYSSQSQHCPPYLCSTQSNEGGETSGENEKSRNDVDAMRRMLEASWNTKDMGTVPSTPESAAETAAESIVAAQTDGRNIMLIDLLLPAYDITQGELYYDEILAAKYCTHIAASLKKSTCIFVSDGKAKRLIDRVLETNGVEKDSNTPIAEEEEDESVKYDDFSDFAETSSMFVVDDADLFRSQLESSWGDDEEEVNKEQSAGMSEAAPQKQGPGASQDKQLSDEVVPAPLHEFGSLLGDSKIKPNSPDMFQQIEKSISSNVFPLIERNDAIIILSAYSGEEMIAVRRIVATYEGKKPIILVNCKLNPMPRELLSAETVYSLLPLMARPVEQSDENLFQGQQKPTSPSPKIVVLRRYPRDWDIFVDEDGSSGFELVTSVPVSSFIGGRQKGPSMEFIAGVVKQHMQFRDSSKS